MFCAFINPPVVAADVFHRDIVFMLDRSGSMTDSLTPHNRFAIVAFDHEQLIFGSERVGDVDYVPLFAANPESIAQASPFWAGCKRAE